MSELKDFITKRTSSFAGISARKLYGLDAFYLSDSPFIVLSGNQDIVIKVEDFETIKLILKIPNTSKWVLNDKIMENWFVLPESFNKKKGKLDPVLEMASKVLLQPKKEKKKKKINSSKKLHNAPSKKNLQDTRKTSIFKRLFNFSK
jgi:hypothetical protein